LSELRLDQDSVGEKHRRELKKTKTEYEEKLSQVKKSSSQEMALLQEELKQQQLIINEKLGRSYYCHEIQTIC